MYLFLFSSYKRETYIKFKRETRITIPAYSTHVVNKGTIFMIGWY